ncbi:MCE family protein [Tomitella biformata]|uniref:MCE family protein n=1 Tax=Tomitella biformata TaxID=630403 RepID=UPI0004639EFE|nr:MCE family protein [Tomitella biformata]
MARAKQLRIGLAALLAVLLVVGVWQVWPGGRQNTITAYFTNASGIYAGDKVAVLGVTVGSIDKIEPEGTTTKITMSVDRDVAIPEDASALIVAQSLVTSRFIQLTPVHRGDGPQLQNGDVIPVERTAVPVEWDEIKVELSKLTQALGPEGDDPGALNKFLNVAGDNLDGNGQRIRDTLRELSAAMSTVSDGRVDLFSTIRNLQTFVSALSSSNQQIVSVSGHLAAVSDVLAASNTQLDTSLKSLDVAVGEVQRFVTDNRVGISENVADLSKVVETIAGKKERLAELLHVGPTSLVNFYNIYQPAQGTFTGGIALDNTGNVVDMVCGAMGGADGTGPLESVQNCITLLTPIFAGLAMNYPPVGTNPITGVTAMPDQVVYTDPSLHNVPKLETPSLAPGNTSAGDADIRQVPTDASAPAAAEPAPSGLGLGDLLLPGLGGGN